MWVDIIYTAKTGGLRQFFAYFTDLTFIGMHAYLMTTMYHHAKYLWPHQSFKRPSSFLDQSSVLNYAYVYLYHTVIVYNIQTPVVFWLLLAKEKLFEAHLSPIDFWMSISLHAVTLFILIVEVIFNRMIIRINMVLLVFGTVLLYMCLVFIIFAVEHWWVYSFLDWSVGPSAIIWYLAISVFIVLCFFLQVGLHKARDQIAKRFVKKYRNHQPTQDDDDEKKETPSEITQTSNFEPLASTIGGGSRITFGENSTTDISNHSSIYY
ncbi:hypothetical protein PS15p_203510 [Mucor circinelloides]